MQEAEGKTEAPEKITTDTLWTQQQPRGWERSRRSPESSERSRDPTGVRNPPDLLPHLCLCSSCEYCSSPQRSHATPAETKHFNTPRRFSFLSPKNQILSKGFMEKPWMQNPHSSTRSASWSRTVRVPLYTTELTVFINGDVHNYYGLYFILAHSWDC